jgi:hypothetical protein
MQIDGPTQWREAMAERGEAPEPVVDEPAGVFDPASATDEELAAKAAELDVDLSMATSRQEAEEAVRQAIVAAAGQ